MNSISELEDLIEDLAEELEPFMNTIPEIMAGMKNTNQPLSIFSTTSFLPKIESIRYGMFEVAKKEEYYSLNILYRALIEHYVKAQYLSLKTFEQEDDNIGIEYWIFGQDKEIIDYSKGIENSYAVLGIKPDKPVDNILLELGILGKNKSKSLIRKKTDQFQYKNMIHFISDSLKNHGSAVPSFLAPMFPLYSELSSCVHGGPESTYAYQSDEKSIFSILEIATFASFFIRYNSYIHFFQYDKRAEPLCHLSQKYINLFIERND